MALPILTFRSETKEHKTSAGPRNLCSCTLPCAFPFAFLLVCFVNVTIFYSIFNKPQRTNDFMIA